MTGKPHCTTSDPAEVMRPLAGFTIIDLLDDPLEGVTRLYSELGAEVVRVESSGLEPDKGPRQRLRARIANLGKTIIRLDAEGVYDTAALAQLLNRADMIVEGFPRRLALPPIATLLRSERRDAVVVMTVSMFGRGNSYEHWQATDPVLHALSSELSRSGLAGREPLLPPGELALQCAMAQATYVGMAALYAARATGRGDRLDVSVLDGAVQALDPGFGISGSATLGRSAEHLPPGRPVKGFQYPIFKCADGNVRLCLLAARQWRNMFRWMGEPPEFASREFDQIAVRQASERLSNALANFFAAKTRDTLEREGAEFGVPISGLLSLSECLKTPHIAERRAVVPIGLPDGPIVQVPDGVFHVDGARMGLADNTQAPNSGAWTPAAATLADTAAPLKGIKILDLGVIVVGGEQSRLLADLGADVVKVESAAFPDGTRNSYLPTGLSVSFAAGHRNKRSLGLNLRHPEGKSLFRRLAAEADVILSNFKPGTMESLGFGYEEIARINPAIIMVESSAFGATGPWAGRMGYGPLVRAAAGLTAKWRYPDDPEGYSDSVTIYPDHVGARYGATAVLALLARRLGTGLGGHATISQLEVMLSHFAAEIAVPCLGPTDDADLPDAPWGVFQTAGVDQWCVVTVRGDTDWSALVEVIGREDWIGSKELSTRKGRLARREVIDEGMRLWLRDQDADVAMQRLQAVGVPAGKMLRVADLQDFGYFRERDFFRVDSHPYMNEHIVAERAHAGSQFLAEPDNRPAPLMGEHSALVVGDWLGLDRATLAGLFAADVLEPIAPTVAQLIASGQGRGQLDLVDKA